MSGTISFSLSQQFDTQGRPLSGGLFYTFVAGTTSTPQSAYQDGALTLPYPNPIVLDSAGRIPQFFLADGLIKIRLTDHSGVVQIVADNVQVIGPSSGGGGGGSTIDPTTIFVTGDIKPRYGVGVHPGATPGWVRANGMGIGSATSSGTPGVGTERANADCQALFEHLWGADTSLAVSGGRGTTAHNDWLANKQLSLPDYRGYALGALDDMGNTAVNRLGAYFANATTLGSAGGVPAVTILNGNLPAYTPAGTLTIGTITLNNLANVPTSTAFTGNNVGGGGGPFGVVNGGPAPITASPSGVWAFNGTPQGGTSTPFGIISPRKLCTIYLKL